jgi:hypothetical protein
MFLQLILFKGLQPFNHNTTSPQDNSSTAELTIILIAGEGTPEWSLMSIIRIPALPFVAPS